MKTKSERERVSLDLDSGLVEELRYQAVRQDRSMSYIVGNAVRFMMKSISLWPGAPEGAVDRRRLRFRMAGVVLAAAGLTLACGGGGGASDEPAGPPVIEVRPSGPGGGLHPGDLGVDLNKLLGLPPGNPVTWRFNDAGNGACSTGGCYDAILTPAGFFTAPTCNVTDAPPAGWPKPVRVEALNPAGVVILTGNLSVDEALQTLKVMCAIPAGSTQCQNPATLTVPVGTTVQFYAGVKASCRSYYDPALPAGACPFNPANGSNDAFFFCALESL